MENQIRVLFLEDKEDDLLLLVNELKAGGFNLIYECASDKKSMEKKLDEKKWDIICSDFIMPQFNANNALDILHQRLLDIPFIVVSGTIGEDVAVECMRNGAQDYIMKDNLARLCTAVDREIKESKLRDERKKAFVALMEGESRYQQLFESESDAVVVFDAETLKFDDANKAALGLFGYTKEEFLDLILVDILYEKEEAIETVSSFYSKQYVNNIVPSRRFIKKDGATFYGEISSGSYIEKERLKVVGVIRDITERKNAHENILKISEELKRATEGGNVALWEGRVLPGQDWRSPEVQLVMSTIATRMLGYSVDEWTHTVGFWVKQVHPDDAERVMMALSDHIDKKSPEFKVEYRLRHKDGHYVWIDAQGKAQWDEKGNVYRMSGASMDITYRKNSEKLNNDLQEQLFQAKKMEAVGTMASGVAHNFNNILGAIRGSVEMVLDYESLDSSAITNLKRAITGVETAKLLTDQMMAYSRSRSDKDIDMEILPIVEDSLNMFRASVRGSIAIHEDLQDDCGCIVGDPFQIEHVLLNILMNSYHAVNSSSGVIEVALSKFNVCPSIAQKHASLKEGEYVKISITDNGHGMDKETLERIFEPFFTTKEVGRGTGLGLSYAHGIVTGYGGDIIVESSPGQGSTFNILLPKAQPSVQ